MAGLCFPNFSVISTALADEPEAPAEEALAEAATDAVNNDEIVSAQSDATGDFTVTGGGSSDYSFDAATGILHVKSSTHLTIKNTDPSVATAHTIQIDPGVKAHITLAGVNISVPAAGPSPIKIVTNSAECGTAVGAKVPAGKETKLLLQLADETVNNLTCAVTNDAGANSRGVPGLRCGEGSVLVIDDSVLNMDASYNIVTPSKGQVPSNLTLIGGKSIKAGESLAVMDASNPGTLNVRGGAWSAGIGSGAYENAGKMIFNGGIINSTASSTQEVDSNVGAGIGGGDTGSGTVMIFNGGRINAQASFHGAGIGCGWGWEYKAGSFASKFPDAITSTNKVGSYYPTVAGDIYINGGVVKAVGASHGNAIGMACHGTETSNTGHEIVVTGGTVLPHSETGRYDIGGKEGYVIVEGGSVFCTAGKFQGKGNTAWGISDTAQIESDLKTGNNENKVSMIEINLTGDLKLIAADPENPTPEELNRVISSWSLKVNGIEKDYGAPACFDNGKLYLWLSAEDAKKEVIVDLSYYDGNGNKVPVEPLYREPNSNTELKRYVYFTIPNEGFFIDEAGSTEVIRIPYDQLDAAEQKTAGEPDAEGKVAVKAITKPYDGLPYRVKELTKDDGIYTGSIDNKYIYDKVSYICQVFDQEEGTLGEQIVLTEMPKDASLSRFIMESKQYSGVAGFMESYWGHRAYGWCEITPVDPAITSLVAHWTDKNGNTISSDDKTTVASALTLTADITSSQGTANTCEAPMGWVQIVVDGEPVGEPIELVTSGSDANAYVTTTKPATFLAQSLTEGVAARATGLPLADDGNWNNGYDGTREHTIFSTTLRATDPGNDWLIPNATEDNKHLVSLEYIPAKNYNPTDGLADEKKPKVPIQAEPVTPPVESKVETPGVTDEKDPQPGDGEKRIERHKLGYDYQDPMKDGATEPDPNANILKVKIDTPSSGAFKVTTTNGAVATAKIQTDEKGNPVRDADGKYTLIIDVESAGETTITVEQSPNGVYYGSTFIYDLDVQPDVHITPDTAVVKTAKNLTHDGDFIRPGDIIEYTITASNAANGSVWQFPYLRDTLPQTVELIPGSLMITNTSLNIMEPRPLAEDEYTFENGTITVPLTRIYGNQQAQLTFKAKVKEGLTGRGTPAELKSVANNAEAQGYTGMEREEQPDGSFVLPDDPGNPFEGDDPDDPGTTDPSDPSNPGGTPTDPTDPDAPKKTPVVKTEQPGKPQVDIIIPNDVQKGDIKVAKVANNLSRQSGSTQVGDKIAYSITVSNVKKDSVWCDTVIKDALPVGLEPIPGTFKLKTATGAEVAVSDDVYHKSDRTVALSCGNLYGGESCMLTFQVEVTKDAIGKDIGNVAKVYGTQPADKLPDPNDPSNYPDEGEDPDDPADPTDPDDPDGSGDGDEDKPGAKDPFDLDNGPEEGSPFWPEEGWEEFAKTHSLPIDAQNPAGGIVEAGNETPAYPLPNDAINKSIDDPNGGAGSDKDKSSKKLPKTGDENQGVATAALAGMVMACAVAVIANRKRTSIGQHAR